MYARTTSHLAQNEVFMRETCRVKDIAQKELGTNKLETLKRISHR